MVASRLRCRRQLHSSTAIFPCSAIFTGERRQRRQQFVVANMAQVQLITCRQVSNRQRCDTCALKSSIAACSVTGQGVESTQNDPAAGALVPSSPEQRHREASELHFVAFGVCADSNRDFRCNLPHVQVFAVALQRRPLFPGSLQPVLVQDPKLIDEILDLKRSG